MTIFKAYDIRGKYPEQLDESKAQAIGWATAKFLKAKKMVVGRDARVSSDPLFHSLAAGLNEAGAEVTDIGQVTTPMSYFACGFYEFDGSIMVTASHNPGNYNGFKICREKAIALSEETGLQDIKKLTEQRTAKSIEPRALPRRQAGKSREPRTKVLNIQADYKKYILSFVKNLRPLKIAVDTANGVVGPVFNEIFKDSPLKITPLFFEPDGRFPNHEPNPMEDKNIILLQETILKTKADFGVAFDGDGDRCVFLDENGQRISSDFITSLIARELLSSEQGTMNNEQFNKSDRPAVVYDLRSSWLVREEITKYGGQPIRERVGHAFIKSTMRRHNAICGGELSGHYYFRSNYFADSALIAFAHILTVVSKENKSFSEIIKPLQRYHSSGEVNFKVTDKDSKIKEIAQLFPDGKQDSLDGLTVEYPDWWFNVRKSNTEPLLRLNVEAKTKEILEENKDKLFKILEQ
ncbi:MAG: phosphomannomutase/phosphoglucomutase [Planctomycetes bacterium]|nr:phosphomannomutase/phosphoglucomutase [Planctomycetota bacterium]